MLRRQHSACLALASSMMLCCTATAALPEKVTFDDHIFPIFREHCLACHDSGGRSGDLALDAYSDTLTGGASGEVVEPGDGGSSRIYRLMAHLDKPIMPPGSDKLPDEQLELVKAWIDGGLLENAGSKAKKSNKPEVEAFVPSADNRPAGEPAMPSGFCREPVLHVPHLGAVADLATSPWAPLVAVTGQRQVLLYHSDSRELLAVVPFVVGMPEVVRFSRNGDLLLVAGGRGAALGVVHLWDIKSGKRITEIGDELDSVLAADLSPDHSLVAIGGPRKKVKVYRTADGSLAYNITKHTDWVTALEFSPNGKYLATADRAGNAHVWEAPTGRAVSNLTGHKQAITAVAWRDDSGLLATASDDGDMRTWQHQGNQVKQWNHGGGVQGMAFTKSGQLVSAARDRFTKLWNADGKEVRKFGPTADIVLAATVTYDQSRVVYADWSGVVHVAQLETGEVEGKLSTNPPTLAMRLDDAKQQLAKAASDLPNAEHAASEAAARLEEGRRVVAEHDASKQQVTDQLAKLQNDRNDQENQLETHRKTNEEIDKAIASVIAEQQRAEAELTALKESLANVSNQEGEDADGEAAGQIEIQISEKQSALEQLLARRAEAETKRRGMTESRKTTKRRLDELNQHIADQEKKLAGLNQAAEKLPKVDTLVGEHDQLKSEVAKLRERIPASEQAVAVVQAEIEAYAAIVPALQKGIAELTQTAETKSAELAKIEEQLAAESADVAIVAREMDELKQRIVNLETLRRKLAGIADKSKSAAGELEQQMAELSSKRDKIEKQLSDIHTAEQLRQQHSKGD